MSGKARMCPKCGNLVGAEDDQCFTCGLQMGTTGHGAAVATQLFRRHGSTTTVLLAVIGLVYLGMVAVQGGPFSQDARESGLISALIFGFDNETYFRCGAEWWPLISEHGEVWRLVTGMFVHGGLLHLLLNGYALLQLGRLSQAYFDNRRTFVIFVTSGVVASLGSYMNGMICMGASGGILGLAGAILVKARFSGGGVDRMIFAQLFRWVFILLVIGFLPGIPIDGWGHFLGLLTGGGVGYLLIREGGVERARMHLAAFWLCVTVCASGLAAGLYYCLQWPPIWWT